MCESIGKRRRAEAVASERRRQLAGDEGPGGSRNFLIRAASIFPAVSNGREIRSETGVPVAETGNVPDIDRTGIVPEVDYAVRESLFRRGKGGGDACENLFARGTTAGE